MHSIEFQFKKNFSFNDRNRKKNDKYKTEDCSSFLFFPYAYLNAARTCGVRTKQGSVLFTVVSKMEGARRRGSKQGRTAYKVKRFPCHIMIDRRAAYTTDVLGRPTCYR